MAITIAAQLSKKVPIPGTDFSSHQASITITAEVSDLGSIHAEANRLYHEAEAAVDAQLGRTAPPPTPAPTPQPPPTAAAPHPAAAPPQSPRRASRPYSAARVTDSQLRLITRLMADTRTDLNAVLHHHQIGDLRDLSCRDASALIDSMKQQPVR